MIVIGPYLRTRRGDAESQTSDGVRDSEARIEEAAGLARAIGLTVVEALIAAISQIRPATYLGKGKVEEITGLIAGHDIELVVMDCALSPIQQRNLEKVWNTKVLDRTGLILEIFGRRAKTKEGSLQVELAHLNYQRSRLVRSWTHLERQRGGFGFLGGPGESQIESDRRLIAERIVRIKAELEKVKRTRSLGRQARKKVPFPVVALVGYTNAGKSTLFNRMTGAEVLAKDMLFATLDPTMRGVVLPSDTGGPGRKIIASDTVGFISDLPTQLVAAFRATLEEVLEADLILHVRDISHPETAEQAQDVTEILASLGVKPSVPVIEVWNKLDLVDPAARAALALGASGRDRVFPVSALTGEGVDGLLAAIAQAFDEAKTDLTLTLPFTEGRKRAWLHQEGVVTSETQTDDGYSLTLRWTARQEKRYRDL